MPGPEATAGAAASLVTVRAAAAPVPAGRVPAGTGDGLRAAMRLFATGVTVLTTGGSQMHGMTANSFTSVSLSPATVLCCVNSAARMHDAIATAGSFAVSVLAADQEPLARYFASRSRPTGSEQFDEVSWRPGLRTGAPLLDGALAWVECRLGAVHDGGSHAIFVGEVLATGCSATRDPLVFYQGSFERVRA